MYCEKLRSTLERCGRSGIVATLIPLLMVPVSAAHAQSGELLDLAEAEALALTVDSTVPRLRALADGMREQGIADGQLPDPRLKLGAANLPTDTFDRTQEPMTQLQLGVQQMFPPAGSLVLREQQANALARAGDAQSQAQQLAVLRDTRIAYLDLFYERQAGHIIDQSRMLFEQLLDVTRAQYAAGRKNQQDVLGAGVELALLDDRRTRVRQSEDRALAKLAQLIGADANRRLPDYLPALKPVPPLARLQEGLHQHPSIHNIDAKIDAGRDGVELARAAYNPSWMLDITYGERGGDNPDGSERSDFLSAMVVVDIPLFKDKRQDRVLAARSRTLEAARFERTDKLLTLKSILDADYASYQRLQERIDLYQEAVVPQSEQNAEASLAAYQSGVSDFSGLMRAHLTALESELNLLRVRVDLALAQARLLYLAGVEQ